MGSPTDPRERKSQQAREKPRVYEDDLGHQVYDGTIKTLNLKLMKTGVFHMSEEDRKKMEAVMEGQGDPNDDLGLEAESTGTCKGYDPYDSG